MWSCQMTATSVQNFGMAPAHHGTAAAPESHTKESVNYCTPSSKTINYSCCGMMCKRNKFSHQIILGYFGQLNCGEER